MLGSNEHHERCHGWAAMPTAFPDVAKRIPEYSPVMPVHEAKIYIERARDRWLMQPHSLECG
jgi:hypothetical protein